MALIPSSSSCIVDDESGKPQILYEGDWTRTSKPAFFGGTTHDLSTTGKATLAFYGDSVSVYGHVASSSSKPNLAVSSYTLDSEQATTFTAPFTNTDISNFLFFQSQNLTLGNHSLVVSYVSGAALSIDYFLYTTPTGPGLNPALKDSSLVSDGTQRTRTYDVGLAAGLSVVTALLILALMMLVWLYRRRRSKVKPYPVLSGKSFGGSSPLSLKSSSPRSQSPLHYETTESSRYTGISWTVPTVTFATSELSTPIEVPTHVVNKGSLKRQLV